jgi:hypothetical protein
MPILAIEEQRRAVTVGKIRLGHQVATRSGKTRPAMLDAFRLTSPAEHQIRAAAQAYGGTPRRVEGGRLSGQWEVYTLRDTLPVMVPNTDSVTQWMEMWSAAGCQRRCDGQTIQMRGQTSPCLCPKDVQVRETQAANGNACKPVTRVSLVLPDLPGLAVWVVESHGINAALEMAQVALSLGLAAERGSFLPAQIRIDHRETRTPSRDPDEPPRVSKFVVPVLEILTSMRELVEGGASSGALRLPPAPSDLKAIGAAPTRPPGRPVPSGRVEAGRAVQDRPGAQACAAEDEPVDAEIIEDDEPPGEVEWPPVAAPGSGAGTGAAEIAQSAVASGTIDEVNRLLAVAQAQRCMSEMVPDPTGRGGVVPLREVLTGRVRDLARGRS